MQKILLANLIFCFTLTACGGGGGGSSDDVVDGGDGKTDVIDITPDDFSFTPSIDQELSAEIISNEVTLSGLDDDTTISVDSGSYSINGADFISQASQVSAGDTVMVMLSTSEDYQATSMATLTVGTVSVEFNATTRIKDITPEEFNFAAVVNVELSTDIVSNQITLAGIDNDTPISITVGAYQINDAPYTNAEGLVKNGDVLSVLLDSGSDYASNNGANLTVGNYTARFTTSTRGKDSSPDAFTFTSQENTELATLLTSNAVTLSGIDNDTSISIANGSYSINGGEFKTAASSQLNSGDTLAVRVTSSTDYEAQTQAAVTVGTLTTTFSVITREKDINPAAFGFTAITEAELNSEVASNTVTISGVDDETPFTFLGSKYVLNGVEIAGGSEVVGGTVNSGDEIALYVATGDEFNTQYQASIAIGSENYAEAFRVTTRSIDNTPNNFEFTQVEDSELSTSNTSSIITLAGIDDETDISITDGLYSLNGGEFTSEAGKVKAGDTLAIKATSANAFETLATANVTVGDFTASYQVTTRQKDTNPSYTGPASVTDAAINSYVESSAITFTEFDGDEISIIGGQYKLNDGEWTAAGTTTLNENDVLTLRVLSSSSHSTQVSSSVGGNGWLTAFRVTTRDDLAPTVTFSKTFEEDGSTSLNGSEELVLTFSETMQIDTLALSGDMAPDCNNLADPTSCLNLDWSESDTVLTVSPKDDFYWYADVRSLQVTITGDGALGLDETISATVLPVFENFQAADVVIGQDDFEGKSLGTSINKIRDPRSITAYEKDGQTALLISDYWNNRVIGYNSVPTSNGADHDRLFGQTSPSSDSRGNNANQLDQPRGAVFLNDRIYIADGDNRRVSWISDENFDVSGDLVDSGYATSLVGQEDFGSVITGQCAQNYLASATNMDAVETDSGTKLIVADGINNRIMIWNNPDESKGADADVVLGQNNFNTCFSYSPSSAGLKSLRSIVGVWSNGEKLVMSSYQNNRLVVWNSIPSAFNASPDFQLGQDSDTASGTNNGQGAVTNKKGMSGPNGIGGNQHQMCVTDTTNHRVLIWSELPDSNDDLPDVLIGQSNFGKNTSNDVDQDGSSDTTINGQVLSWPRACDISNEQLFVADSSNHRVLVFNALNKRPDNN